MIHLIKSTGSVDEMDATESVLLVNPTEERIYCIKPVDLIVVQSNSQSRTEISRLGQNRMRGL
jgi:hypothetical protein